jgi:iron complex outermembrane recepter protein
MKIAGITFDTSHAKHRVRAVLRSTIRAHWNIGRAMKIMACGFALWGTLCDAQQLSISGTVSDANGVVPGASVTLRAPAGAKSETQTDSEGKYSFDKLISGPYELAFAKEGFATNVRALSIAGEASTVDATLAVAGLSSTVHVTDAATNSTGSRMDVPDQDIPSQISVVTQQTIQEQGLNDVATALENISGASVQVQYGVYEWYTLDGFAQQSGNDFLYIDGMTLMGNRPQTQLDNAKKYK